MCVEEDDDDDDVDGVVGGGCLWMGRQLFLFCSWFFVYTLGGTTGFVGNREDDQRSEDGQVSCLFVNAPVSINLCNENEPTDDNIITNYIISETETELWVLKESKNGKSAIVPVGVILLWLLFFLWSYSMGSRCASGELLKKSWTRIIIYKINFVKDTTRGTHMNCIRGEIDWLDGRYIRGLWTKCAYLVASRSRIIQKNWRFERRIL